MGNGTPDTRSFTFDVDDVEPAALPLKEIPPEEAFCNLLQTQELLALSTPEQPLVADMHGNPFMTAVHLAHSEHRPLIISPDAVWLTILQGFAHHVTNHAEELRHLLVTHRGRETIRFETSTWDWAALVESMSNRVIMQAKGDVARLLCDFSTSTAVDKTASRILLMDAFQPYYEYNAYAICGIPTITLEGTPEDWTKLKKKVEYISRYQLQWWTDRLLPLCDEFIQASQGQPNRTHWQNIYKRVDAYGAERINGWSTLLFAYLKDGLSDRCTVRNPMLSENPEDHPRDIDTGIAGLVLEVFPDLPGSAPLVLVEKNPGDEIGEMEIALEVMGGLMGVEQNRATRALKPVSGWAVVRSHGVIDELNRFQKLLEMTPPLDAAYTSDLLHESHFHRVSVLSLPGDLVYFYNWCNGGRSLDGRVRFLSLEEALERSNAMFQVEPGEGEWPLAEIDDGDLIYMREIKYDIDDDYYYMERRMEYCVGRGDELLIIALSLREFIRRWMDSPEVLYFQQPDFEPYPKLNRANIEEYLAEKSAGEGKGKVLSEYHADIWTAWSDALEPPYEPAPLQEEFNVSADGSLSPEVIDGLLNMPDDASPGTASQRNPAFAAKSEKPEISFGPENPEFRVKQDDLQVATRICRMRFPGDNPKHRELFLHLTMGTSRQPDDEALELICVMESPHRELCDLLAEMLAEHYRSGRLTSGASYTIVREGLWAELDFHAALLHDNFPFPDSTLPNRLAHSRGQSPVLYAYLLTEEELKGFQTGELTVKTFQENEAVFRWRK